MNAVEILKAAKVKIENPADWTQGDFARDKEGRGLGNGYDSRAVCFCTLGAIEAVTGSDFFRAYDAYDAIDKAASAAGAANYNDNHTHTEVLELFDKAIKLAQAAN